MIGSSGTEKLSMSKVRFCPNTCTMYLEVDFVFEMFIDLYWTYSSIIVKAPGVQLSLVESASHIIGLEVTSGDTTDS
jgi:hypothetical protein